MAGDTPAHDVNAPNPERDASRAADPSAADVVRARGGDVAAF
jgi:hypothetical protein